MPGDEEEAENASKTPEEKGVSITEDLITKRNLTFPEDEDLSDKMFQTLDELETVRLDREGITSIGNLESLRNIHSLYLQSNKIQRIENLACIASLRFLSLAGNQIKQVENLLDLQYLQFLDLSENLIETLKLDELPQSLLILNLCGNPCTNKDGYRKMVIEALPLLLDLDKQPIMERWTSDEEDKSSDEEEEFPELNGPFCADRGFFKDLDQEMHQHQERRQRAVLAEHLSRMETQPVLTDLPLLPTVPMAGDCSSAVTAQPEEESPPKAASPSPAASPSLAATPSPAASSTKKQVPRSQKSSAHTRKEAPAATAPKTSSAVGLSKTKTTTKRSTK